MSGKIQSPTDYLATANNLRSPLAKSILNIHKINFLKLHFHP
ncbi:hypothetical protein [Nostoc sp. DSM 114161]